jgi:two-component system chemotaxis response regulator CheB
MNHHDPFRILLVDDSSVVRRVLTDVIAGEPGLIVAGTASNGKLALDRIEQLKPHLVVMDIEMPEMDGLTALAELRKRNRRLPVIMCSTLTQRGAEATLDALTLGADDYVSKERNTLGFAAAISDLKRELLPKIHALCERRSPSENRAASVPLTPAKPKPRLDEKPIEILVIGVSTGGPDALSKVLPALPGNLPVPVIIVQHMPPVFTKLLAERLSAKTAVPVKEAVGGETVAPGTIWIAPGGHHLRMECGTGITLHLDDSPPQNFCRPSVDVLFESAAEIFHGGTLAVVLTGMGSDGLRGCELIRQCGGQIVAQDEATSIVWGMPGAVARAGLADSVKPVHEIAGEIVRRVTQLRPGADHPFPIPPRRMYAQYSK